MSPQSLRSDFQDALLSFVWRQWGQLGVAANMGGQDPWCIDPEALLVFSLELLRHEPRQFDEVLDWLETNGDRLIRQRVTNLLPMATPEAARVVEASLARSSRSNPPRHSINDASELVPLFHGLPEEAVKFGISDPTFARYGLLRPTFTPSGKTTSPHLLARASFPFRLRELFGAGSRSEAVRYLMLAPGNEAGTKEIADAITLGRQNVHRALEGLAAAGVCGRRVQGNRDVWSLSRQRWLNWLELPAASLPTWVDWPVTFNALLVLWRWLSEPERTEETAYIRASRARKLMKTIAPGITRGGLSWRPATPELLPGESYAAAFDADVQRLATLLRDGDKA